MKAKIIPIVVLIAMGFFLFNSCEDSTYRIYTGNSPVYMSYDNLRKAVKVEQNAELENPGKIYFKDNYIFIVEELKGIHVYDNSNPASPVRKAFVNLPGVVDISISGYIMYADSFVDLVVLDVQDINNIHEAGRIKDILPYTVPPADNDYPLAFVDEDKGVVIDWEVEKIKEKVNQDRNPYPIFWLKADFAAMSNSSGNSSGVSGGGVGVGGSMARFGIKGNVLYVLDQNTLKVFDITNKTSPVKHNDLYPGWGVETMYLTENTMFLGTTTGMVIFDISIPLSPQTRKFFSHARSCDPVIVDDTLAYITLRTGTTCGGSTNTLSVVNVKNINSPSLVATYSMTNPHGLGKDGDLLFICDGNAGLKIYDASDPKTITNHLVYTYPNINTYDVIPLGNVLVLIGDDGLYQYDYSNVLSIRLISSILTED
ncbi:MAG TPA: hypothetical protein PK521_03055 [Bacteroidales bacterium]|nr:hypothetical protein [Bacteroidales bacterium]HQM68260.1 hypothetical protein [Bacteroidales bacterium]